MIKFLIQVILDALMCALLFFNIFVSKRVDPLFTFIVLAVFLILNLIVFRWKKVHARDATLITLLVISMTGLLMLVFYGIGFYSGFSYNYSTMFKRYIKPSVWMLNFGIVFICEISRNVTLQIKQKNNFQKYFLMAIMLFSYMLVDLSIATKTYDLRSFTQLYEFFALIVVQSIAKNTYLNYLSGHYGVKPCLFYRLIMDLYIYIVPVVPKVNMFIKAVLLLVYPYVMYMVMTNMDERKLPDINLKDKKKKDGVATFVSAIIFAILVMLVSREFTYSMIAIGSGSMTGTINKGDAIVYKKVDMKNDKPKVGDVLVFYKENTVIVHRIVSEFTVDGVKAYKTKGDANDSVDNWVVKSKDCIGVVKFRVLWIAWPSVILNEIF